MSLRDLDAMFAEKVLGWTFNPGSEPYWFDTDRNKKHDAQFWNPHASLDAAWLGVEKIIEGGWTFGCVQDEDEIQVNLHNDDLSTQCDKCLAFHNRYESAKHHSFPLAILKACLLAKGVTEQEIKEMEDK
jgi:hypothetical protein